MVNVCAFMHTGCNVLDRRRCSTASRMVRACAKFAVANSCLDRATLLANPVIPCLLSSWWSCSRAVNSSSKVGITENDMFLNGNHEYMRLCGIYLLYFPDPRRRHRRCSRSPPVDRAVDWPEAPAASSIRADSLAWIHSAGWHDPGPLDGDAVVPAKEL